MALIDTDQLQPQLHAVAVARRDFKAAQRALEAHKPGKLEETLQRIDIALLVYNEALLALGDRVSMMVDLEPPPPTLTIVPMEPDL